MNDAPQEKKRSLTQNRAEIWKDIFQYEGKYQVSNFGRVKSLIRKNRLEEKIMKPVYKKIGYIQITLTKNHQPKIFLVHRLVAQHFLDNPNNKPQINHKDGNGFNNYIENLEWCNASENGLHSYRILGNKAWQKGKKGECMPTSKPVFQKTADGKIIKRWGCGLDAVREGGFESSCISRCVNGKSVFHKGFLWEYAK